MFARVTQEVTNICNFECIYMYYKPVRILTHVALHSALKNGDEVHIKSHLFSLQTNLSTSVLVVILPR